MDVSGEVVSELANVDKETKEKLLKVVDEVDDNAREGLLAGITDPMGSVSIDLARYCRESGVVCAPLSVRTFDGVRGVAASSNLQPGERILAVPASQALQVTTIQPCPRWADENSWRQAPWDARLALCLLRARDEQRQPPQGSGADPATARARWLATLPTEFTTPLFWDESLLRSLRYPPLEEAVSEQRREWRRLHQLIGSAYSLDDFLWAMSTVRSRAFSGPYSPSTLKGSLQQLSFASALALLYLLSGAGAPEQALNGLLAVLVSLVISDFLLPRFSAAKRYVLCPWIDLLNHHSSRAGSQLAYEYFTDAFAAVLDGTPTAAGEQALISYGPRPNEQLLQYYGFVEADNPYDSYTISTERLLLAVARVAPYGAARLKRLRGLDPAAQLSFSRAGADDEALRLCRGLLAADGADGGSLADGVRALRVLAEVSELLAAEMGAERGAEMGAEVAGPAASEVVLARSFREEKARVLTASAAALRRRADESEAAGELLPPAAAAAGGAPAPTLASGPTLPGLGLSRIQ